MGAKKPKVVIIGAGMAGLTAAHKLYSSTASRDLFELCVVEGGERIGGRIYTSMFGGNRIEMGATWIHGIGGSPVYRIARETGSLESQQPWECMDGFLEGARTVAEGGLEVNPAVVERISSFFNALMDYAQGKTLLENGSSSEEKEYYDIAAKAVKVIRTSNGVNNVSVGNFLRQALEIYWEISGGQDGIDSYGSWSRKLLEEAVFAMHENIQRTYTSAGDLSNLDFNAESEYRMFPGEEITIARGYSSVIESLASVLPDGMIKLGKLVERVEWSPETGRNGCCNGSDDSTNRPVKVHFCDGSMMNADHVIVTVSLGVLKAKTQADTAFFLPPLPDFKREAISRLGFGVVNKLFLQLGPKNKNCTNNFPVLQMAFHRADSDVRSRKVPCWMRRTASISPIYNNSNVLLSWFAGEEALQIEELPDEEMINGVSRTISCLSSSDDGECKLLCNGNERSSGCEEKLFTKVLKSKWGTDPLFLGSYSYVGVGSSGDDLDAMAEPLPSKSCEPFAAESPQPLQILFAGEATHRTHYSTTHGAYFSGLREANRLLQHYHCD